jgi:hypothetical protein
MLSPTYIQVVALNQGVSLYSLSLFLCDIYELPFYSNSVMVKEPRRTARPQSLSRIMA